MTLRELLSGVPNSHYLITIVFNRVAVILAGQF